MPALDRIMPALVLALAAAGAAAQTVRTVQETALRAERASDAAPLAALRANAPLSLLQLSGGWAQVQMQTVGAAPQRGWVRASLLDLRPPQVAAVSQLETGRRAGATNAVTLGSRSLPPRDNRHALIIGVGRYRADPARPVDALVGVEQDMASALAMARALQVPDDHITLLRDEAATHEGIASAIRALGRRALPGDRVFVYWSGHGSRYFDAAEDGCVESLVPFDLKDVTNRELARWLQPIGATADKMLVIYDACHSGGVGALASAGPVTRALGGLLRPKFTAPGGDACQTPSNLRTRSLSGAVAALGLSGQDVVHLSSSRADELSLDNAQTGGLATTALRDCLLGDARDVDGSGSVSAQELADCAQAKVDASLAGNAQFAPPHLTLAGNRDFVPAWFRAGAAAAAALPAPAAPATAPMATVLAQIHEQRDGKRTVELRMARERLRIGADRLGFTITSSHAGRVYVAMLGSDGQTLQLLFPNRLDADNAIRAGEPMTLPRPAWQVSAGGPPGLDQLLVLVTDGPRDLPALRARPVGPFVEALTDAEGRARLQWLLGTSSARSGSDAFGAALVRVEEY